MLPDREGQVRVRASFDGWVELKVKPGDVLLRGGAVAVVEGDTEMETLCARSPSRVISVEAVHEQEVVEGAVLAVIVEIGEDEALAQATKY